MRIQKMVQIALVVTFSIILTVYPKIVFANGYVHLGDSMIYLAAAFYGSAPAAFVGGVGHGLADVLGGYFNYSIATFFIKGVMGYIVGLVSFGHVEGKRIYLSFLCGLPVLLVGYFVVDLVLYGYSGALLSLLHNLIQWVFSVFVTIMIFSLIKRAKINLGGRN